LKARADDVVTGIREGWLRLNISATLPLEEAREAHIMMESRRSQGKIVLDIVAD
jgi:NADPH2:quinone reductase